MNLKVLKLDWWMTRREDEGDMQACLACYVEIEPKVHRNGRYIKGKEAWFEINGKAYEDKQMIRYELDLLNALEVPKEVYVALLKVPRGWLSLRQLKFLQAREAAEEIKYSGRMAAKHLMEFKVKIRAKLKQTTGETL